MSSLQPDVRLLSQFTPLNKLTETQRQALRVSASLSKYSPSSMVMEMGSADGLEYFLLKGKLELVSNDDRKRVIEAGSESAKTPIALLQPRKYNVSAVVESILLIVKQEELKRLLKELPHEGTSSFRATELQSDQSVESLLSDIKKDLAENRLSLPSFPDVALRISQLLELPDVSIQEVSQAISNDPAITVKLIKTCNSALYPAINDITSCQDAVVRLGLQTTKQLVSIFSLKELFDSENKFLQAKIKELWEGSREIACVAYVLAEVTPKVSSEKALLAGLIHQVGAIPVLKYVEQYPDLLAKEEKLDALVNTLVFEVGEAILQEWGFEDFLLDAVSHAGDTEYSSGASQASYAEIVIAARVLYRLDADPLFTLHQHDLPDCFTKLGESGLSLEQCQLAIDEAHQKMDDLKALLKLA